MTEEEKLLALEAACIAAHDPMRNSPGVTAAIELLTQELMGVLPNPPTFGEYLKRQMAAVKKLAKNPQAFGAK